MEFVIKLTVAMYMEKKLLKGCNFDNPSYIVEIYGSARHPSWPWLPRHLH